MYAGLLVALDVSFSVMALGLRGTFWHGIEAYASGYRGADFVPQAIGLASLPALIMMLASDHALACGSRRLWTSAALAFGTAHVVLLGSLYFVQVAVLLPALRQGRWQGLEQLAFANPRSVAWGLDHFAWSLLGAALVLAAVGHRGSGLRTWIRPLLVLNGVANILLIPAYAFGLEALTLAIALASWVIGLPLTAILIALDFRNAGRTARDGGTATQSG